MTRLLYLDCFSGVSGDMLLGACLDAGVPLDAVRAALGSLGLDDYDVSATRVLRAGVSATRWVLDERIPAGAVPSQEREQVHGHETDRGTAPPADRDTNTARRTGTRTGTSPGSSG